MSELSNILFGNLDKDSWKMFFNIIGEHHPVSILLRTFEHIKKGIYLDWNFRKNSETS
jgi:hypothetical protein